MHWIDYSIFGVYLTAMLGIGFYFMRKNKSADDYFVGGRKMSAFHIGLSVVATDVGGGFSIGLGGLGFVMGLSGSWLLFTGLIGAWLSAVLLIPKVSKLATKHNFLSFPQFLENLFNGRVALIAGLISAIGYLGFTSSQILAGAKLASATFPNISLQTALILMGIIAVVYTSIGGIKAVIYTDTFQWLLLLSGLVFVALPVAYFGIGGYETLQNTLPDNFFSLTAVSWQQIVNWFITIVPIWFIGMTLYQRIYAAGNKKTAQRAWFVAGLFEYPVMAFTGVFLGMFAKAAFEDGIIGAGIEGAMDPEMGLPILLRTILPVGLTGLILSAYFSAIMSTADSCLMASSGNLITDIFKKHKSGKIMLLSQATTLVLGAIALVVAWKVPNVLDLMLHSYSFMVSGLFIPVLAGIFMKKKSANGAFWSMIIGGSVTLSLILSGLELPLGLDANFYGIILAALTYALFHFIEKPGDSPVVSSSKV
ncbi:solute:Na+ symporter, SSS family [Tangfeifania diversioriginum]|uniref:Solute:Na+ symporter, SSS family n=1 Tax=Tangfeifania diversioriginum TaxID=1168035 RepID=A0A1M6L1N4_9BACT|nr:sodium:solute symporter family protein [Tangfeifania diversioriginum]SHJ65107.1 solute:Na+ symporter, SSS family [Tangfeifania diversioriginum]